MNFKNPTELERYGVGRKGDMAWAWWEFETVKIRGGFRGWADPSKQTVVWCLITRFPTVCGSWARWRRLMSKVRYDTAGKRKRAVRVRQGKAGHSKAHVFANLRGRDRSGRSQTTRWPSLRVQWMSGQKEQRRPVSPSAYSLALGSGSSLGLGLN